jgi:hypothetical protein
MSGFFGGIAATKGLSCRGSLHPRRGILDSNRLSVVPAWELPNWSLRLVIAFLLIGFPIALILAWAYEIKRPDLTGAQISFC